jgi:hypothetical protein
METNYLLGFSSYAPDKTMDRQTDGRMDKVPTDYMLPRNISGSIIMGISITPYIIIGLFVTSMAAVSSYNNILGFSSILTLPSNSQ